jgi:2-keto-4-pentenoate hydratase/2-oxohepta-3-ene-1,7-dioic acid hydratase in catechol pathway
VKIARYEHHGFAHVGVIKHGQIQSLPTRLDVLEILALPRKDRDLLELQAGRYHRADLDTIRLLPPVEPRAMRDFVAFEAHIAGMKKSEGGSGEVPKEWYEAPAFLFMNPWSLSGATDDIAMPPDTEAFDFELEIAAVIGKTAKDVCIDEAAEYIAGYTILNDWSARDIQGREMKVGLGPSKGKDFANTLGPWITTPDELAPYRVEGRLSLDMSVAINGTTVGNDNSSNMSWSFEELLVHASRGATVGAGDVLASGTCSSGALAETWSRTGIRTPPPLAVGDLVTMTIGGLGSIENRIVAAPAAADRVAGAQRRYSEDRL